MEKQEGPGMFETVATDVDERGVATVTLNRPEKHNALSGRMIEELTALAQDLASDDTVRVVVLTGAGKSFCAGGDLGWMQDQMAADPASRAAEAKKLAVMLGTWNSLPKPVIAKVQGAAFGGGVGMMCVVDKAICVDTAQFGLTETKLGLVPATIGPYVAARLGPQTREFFMSSARFGAETALRIGLAAETVPADVLEGAVEKSVLPYLACAPGAVAASKAMALSLGPAITDDVIDATIATLNARWESDEAREGIAAFFERRKASWVVDD